MSPTCSPSASIRTSASQVQAESLRVSTQVSRLEPKLVTEEQIVHLQEPILARRRLCRFGSRLSMRVDLAEREVPEYDLDSGATVQQATDLADRLGGVRALEIAVHHQLRAPGDASGVVARVHRG